MRGQVQQTAIIDKLLTNVSQMVRPYGYICDMLLPYLPSKQKTGKIAEYGTGHLRQISSRVGGDGEFKRVQPITRSNDNYEINSYGLYNNVTQDDYDNVEQPFQAETDEVIGLTSLIKMEKETALVTLLNSASQGETLSGNMQFSNKAADPFEIIPKARNTVLRAAGVSPNTAIVPAEVYNVLTQHPMIREYYRGGATSATGGPVSMEDIKKLLQVERLLIPEVPVADEDGNLSQLWGKHIYYLVAPKSAMKYQICYGYRMGLRSRGGKPVVYKFRTKNPPNGTQILVGDNYTFVESNPRCIYRLADAIA